MILIAESGSSKTDWKIIDKNKNILSLSTGGMNPIHQTSDFIYNELRNAIKNQYCENIRKIYFYGAGCIPQKIPIIENALNLVFKNAEIEVNDDLLAVARALCGSESGIACILGTGSNSCLYDGTKIIDRVPALGYILGDEGSGAVLGRKLIADFLKREMPAELEKKFKRTYNPEMHTIIKNVYGKTSANTYLATFSEFLYNNLNNKYVQKMIYDNFSEFFNRNILKYKGAKNYYVNFTGSIAYFYRKILTDVVKDKNLKMGKIIKAPINELVEYHIS